MPFLIIDGRASVGEERMRAQRPTTSGPGAFVKREYFKVSSSLMRWTGVTGYPLGFGVSILT